MTGCQGRHKGHVHDAAAKQIDGLTARSQEWQEPDSVLRGKVRGDETSERIASGHDEGVVGLGSGARVRQGTVEPGVVRDCARGSRLSGIREHSPIDYGLPHAPVVLPVVRPRPAWSGRRSPAGEQILDTDAECFGDAKRHRGRELLAMRPLRLGVPEDDSESRRAILLPARRLRVLCPFQTEARQKGGGLTMKAATLGGIVLIVIGLVSLAYGGINYTREETIVDIGPIEATAETEERIPLSPVVGAVALVGGIILLVAGRRK